MPDVVYDYTAVPTVRDFARNHALFVRGLMGPFGSGKSSGCVIELPRWTARQNKGRDGKRRARFAVVRNTYRQLEDTTMRTVQQWLPEAEFGKLVATKHSYVVDRLAPDMEFEILFRALDRPEHLANLLSLDLTGAWVNEAREIPWTIIKGLMGRVGRYPAAIDGGCVDPGIIMDTNPPDDESWWYKKFEEEKPNGWRLFRQPSGRAPNAENLPYLPAGYYQRMVDGGDPDFIKVYVDGEYGFVRDGKPIYPSYNDRVHCRDIEYMKGLPIYRGWDFGLTPACTFSQLLPNGIWNTFEELTSEDMDIDTFGDAVLRHCGTEWPDAKRYIDTGDPAGMQRSPTAKATEENSCFKILQGKNIMVESGEQTLTIRIGSVNKALNTMVNGQPQLAVHSRCAMLRKGYQGRYQYRRLKIAGTEERYTDEPDKNAYSHPHDANQYTAARIFGAALRNKQQQPQATSRAHRPLDAEIGL